MVENGGFCALGESGGEILGSMRKRLEKTGFFFLKNSTKMGYEGLFFCAAYITMWLIVE